MAMLWQPQRASEARARALLLRRTVLASLLLEMARHRQRSREGRHVRRASCHDNLRLQSPTVCPSAVASEARQRQRPSFPLLFLLLLLASLLRLCMLLTLLLPR